MVRGTRIWRENLADHLSRYSYGERSIVNQSRVVDLWRSVNAIYDFIGSVTSDLEISVMRHTEMIRYTIMSSQMPFATCPDGGWAMASHIYRQTVR